MAPRGWKWDDLVGPDKSNLVPKSGEIAKSAKIKLVKIGIYIYRPNNGTKMYPNVQIMMYESIHWLKMNINKIFMNFLFGIY